MDCPRCGQANVAREACPHCGIVFAKLRVQRQRPRAGAPRPVPRQPPAPRTTLALLLGGVSLAALAILAWQGSSPTPRAPRSAVAAQTKPAPAATAEPSPSPARKLQADPGPSFPSPRLSLEDRARLGELIERVNRRSPLSERDLRDAEGIQARNPDEQDARDLLGAVLLAAGAREAQARHLDAALGHLRRAVTLLPSRPEARLALLQVLHDSGDWAGAEAAARELLALAPHDPDVLERLAFALFRQDRNREAAERLREALELRPTTFARSLLDRIEKTNADERGMTEQQLSHFNVRYDGDAHEDVGREILRVLERHYATLASTLDHQPATTIPVILFSRQQYYDASGAPSWSAGVYEPIDGRIRVPIKGLSASLTPELERTLIHEVAHAFLADRTRGLCPREIHEGFAQYMEGKRISDELAPEQLKALADGRIPGVAGFYMQALCFVEYLLGARGQGGINDLLREMGETADVDEAFRRVYGADSRAMRGAWLARLRQQHGS